MKIGKASIRIEVEGCVKCGTRWSSGWIVYRVVPVKIGDHQDSITLRICADCQRVMKTQNGGEQKTSLSFE